jgi:fatty-acid O-methyltransferase
MEKNSQKWLDLIDRRLPAFLHGLARAQTGVQGGRTYRALQNGELSYRMYGFAKD